MKHLHIFSTAAEYEAVKDTLEMPYIVSIDETDGLQYNTDVVRVPQGSAGSGGGELEGEYFLAKPNGRYWKSKLSRMLKHYRAEFPQIIEPIKAEDTETFLIGQAIFSMLSYTSIIGGREGLIDHGYEIYAEYPLDVAELYGRCECGYGLIGEIRSHWCSVAWEEADAISPLFSQMGLDGPVDVVAFMRVMMEGEADDMTDDEILALVEDMFMVEQVTKEEYESWYNW
jgi:hypothetical protein